MSVCVCASVRVCVGSVQASDKIKAQPMLKSHSFRTPSNSAPALYLGTPDCNLIRFVAWPTLSAYLPQDRLHTSRDPSPEYPGTKEPYPNGLQYYPAANALRFSAA